MSRSLSLIVLLVAATSVAAGKEGVVGISVGHDFTVITAVATDSPAARAGVRVGDRIVAIDDQPTAELQKADFARRVSGPPDSEIELQLQRAGTDSVLRIRLRRIPAPAPRPSQIPPGFDARQVRSDANGPNQVIQRTI